MRVQIHASAVEACSYPLCLRDDFHFHWKQRVFSSAFGGEMTEEERAEFDVDCTLDTVERGKRK